MDAGLPLKHDNRALSSGSGTADLSAQGGEGDRPVAWINDQGGSNLKAAETRGTEAAKPAEAQDARSATTSFDFHSPTLASSASGPLGPGAGLSDASSASLPATLTANPVAPNLGSSNAADGVSPAGQGPEASPRQAVGETSEVAAPAQATAEPSASTWNAASPGVEQALSIISPAPATPGLSLPISEPPKLEEGLAPVLNGDGDGPGLPEMADIEVLLPTLDDLPALPSIGDVISELSDDDASGVPGLPDLDDILSGLELPTAPDVGALMDDLLGAGPGGGELIDLSNLLDQVLATLPVPAELQPAGGAPADAIASLTDGLPILGEGALQTLLDGLTDSGDDSDDDGAMDLAGLPALPDLTNDSGLPDLDEVLGDGPGGVLASLFDGDQADAGPAFPNLGDLAGGLAPPVLGGLLGGGTSDDPSDQDGGGFGLG